MYINQNEDLRIGKIITHIVLIIVLIPSLWGSFGTIDAGNRGVLLQLGAVRGIKGEGLYFKIPFVQNVVEMNVQTQKVDVKASSASKDLQTVTADVTPNYHINPEKVSSIYQLIGVDYEEVLIQPALQESVKAITANYTAEELITKREQVRDAISELLKNKVNPNGIIIDSVNITNFDFSKSFNEAIEAKVTAEQSALAAKNKKDQVQYEADQAVIQAKGKAEALEIEGRAITQNPQVLQGRAIEKWNGILPTVTGSNIPFINIK